MRMFTQFFGGGGPDPFADMFAGGAAGPNMFFSSNMGGMDDGMGPGAFSFGGGSPKPITYTY